MPITPTKGLGMRKASSQNFEAICQVWINILEQAGEEAIKEARLHHKYLNQTGNLASSVGYAIIRDGKVLKKSTFDVVGSGTEGAKVGMEYLDKIIAKNAEGLVLILVAGMPYAKYVEAMGLDVLDSAEKTADRIVEFYRKSLNV